MGPQRAHDDLIWRLERRRLVQLAPLLHGRRLRGHRAALRVRLALGDGGAHALAPRERPRLPPQVAHARRRAAEANAAPVEPRGPRGGRVPRGLHDVRASQKSQTRACLVGRAAHISSERSSLVRRSARETAGRNNTVVSPPSNKSPWRRLSSTTRRRRRSARASMGAGVCRRRRRRTKIESELPPPAAARAMPRAACVALR